MATRFVGSSSRTRAITPRSTSTAGGGSGGPGATTRLRRRARRSGWAAARTSVMAPTPIHSSVAASSRRPVSGDVRTGVRQGEQPVVPERRRGGLTKSHARVASALNAGLVRPPSILGMGAAPVSRPEVAMRKTGERRLAPADDDVVDFEAPPDRCLVLHRVRVEEGVRGEVLARVDHPWTRGDAVRPKTACREMGDDHPIRDRCRDGDLGASRRRPGEPALARRTRVRSEAERDAPQGLVTRGQRCDRSADAVVEGDRRDGAAIVGRNQVGRRYRREGRPRSR